MLKESKKKKLLLPLFILKELCNDTKDRTSNRINCYLDAIFKKVSDDKINKFLEHYKDRFFYEINGLVLRKPPITRNSEILKNYYAEHLTNLYRAKTCKYSGHKVLRMLFYYVQMMFNEYHDREVKNKEELKILHSLLRVLNYTLYHEWKARYEKLKTEEDFQNLEASAEKQAKKYFAKYYINL
jgi:hypothetical protein